MPRPRAGELLTIFALAALGASVVFALCALGVVAACVLCLLLGATAALLARAFYKGETRWWHIPLFCLLAASAGALVALLLPGARTGLLLAPVMAALGALGGGLAERAGRRRCGLCNRRVSSAELMFACPRCSLSVCDGRCWDFDHRRCRLCTQNAVPLLPSSDQWWDRVFGPRAAFGSCRVCLGSYQERDLRPCGNCRRPLCRQDWDHANGECERCGWVCPELPASLRAIAVTAGEGTETAHSR